MKKVSNILWGAVLIAIGVILALNAFGITDINIFFKGWWTLFIIVPGAISLVTDRDKVGSLICVGIGVFLLLCCRDVLDFSMIWKLLIPAVVIIIGLKLIFGGAFRKKETEAYKNVKIDGEMKSGTATFSGTDMNFADQKFEGAELNAIFGGVKCDLRGAIIENDCVINATSVFGGITVLVPDDLNVKINSTCVFGGASDSKKAKGGEGAHTLYINATCIFGGLEVK